MLLAQAAIFMLALTGIGVCSIGLIYFLGRAMSRARPGPLRLRSAALAVLALCGIVASGAGGFVGIAAIMYFAQR